MRTLIFLNLLRLNLKHKKKFFKIRYITQYNKLVSLFLKLNLIKFTKIHENSIYIWPNLTNQNVYIQNYRILYRLSGRQNITLKTLKKLQQTKYAKLLVLSTSRGYLTNEEALRANIGGILFIKLF